MIEQVPWYVWSPGKAVHTCNPSSRKVEAGEPEVPGLHRELEGSLSQANKWDWRDGSAAKSMLTQALAGPYLCPQLQGDLTSLAHSHYHTYT